MSRDSALLKLELLSHGINYDEAFLKAFEGRIDLLEKRRAYGAGDNFEFAPKQRIPQELILEGQIVCAINFDARSPWRLSFDDGSPMVSNGRQQHYVALPTRPTFYGMTLSSGQRVEEIITLYGTGTLGIFSLGHCYYFNDSRECTFCSLGPARRRVADHPMRVRGKEAREAVEIALATEPVGIGHVLLNGGTAREYDKAFVNMAHVLAAALDAPGADALEGHMISMPPKDFRLFDLVARQHATIAMSLEIWDPKIFAEECPGKHLDYGRDQFLDAYEAAINQLGKGNVYAGFVAGLEPVESLVEGMHTLAEKGAAPAVAVFHPDAGSKLATRRRPASADLLKIGLEMAAIYKAHNFRPLISGSGRNSLDTEAYQQYFS